MCPFYKSVAMMRNIILFYSLGIKAIENATAENKVTMNVIKDTMGGSTGVLYKISSMKFLEPSAGEEVNMAAMSKLSDEIRAAYQSLHD